MSSSVGPVLITGCSTGLGNAAARAFCTSGHLTIATARDPDTLAGLASLGCQTMPLDVTDEHSCKAAVAEIERRFGSVGVLINNAGYGQYGPLEEISPEQLRGAFETNVFGLLRMTQLVLPGMRRAGGGRIVNVSSVGGRVSVQGGGVYHMTKHAIEALADAMRPELKPFGIDLVSILSGPFVSAYRDKVVASLPDTGPDSPYRVYKQSVARFVLEFLRPGRFGVMSAERVAQVVLKAATVPQPRTRYHVGYYARLGPIGRALAPDRLVDAVMSRTIPHR